MNIYYHFVSDIDNDFQQAVFTDAFDVEDIIKKLTITNIKCIWRVKKWHKAHIK